ncbi:unknown protein [Seminavis robusta]|uniref:Uncharacterized protein n=1 Tax=Seminavis robusta TaxID=568900 RepID=A0A9N8HK86_9STRA|nr:unknown protein [Seminavis robusta]|eukprot:Sro599_g173300.1 n/a (1025) ;mRNA; f:41247-44555
MFSNVVIVFLRLIRERRRLLMNAWVPLDFLAHEIDVEIDDEDSPVSTKVLRKELRNAHLLGRPFVPSDDPSLQDMAQITTTKRRVSHRKESLVSTKDGTKKKDFLYVQQKGKKPFKWPDTDDKVQVHFQKQYDFFGRRLPLIISTEEATANTDNEQAPRAVTPTECEPIQMQKNRDVRELLQGIVDDSALAQIDEASVALLRNRVKDLGHGLHKQSVKNKYSSETDMQYKKKDIATLDEDLYSTLTHEFSIPLSLDAFKALGSAVNMVADDVPEARECLLSSIGLNSKAAAKPSNRGLMKAIVPSKTQGRLYANAKTWMPTALSAAVHKDSALKQRDAVVAFAKVLSIVDNGAFGEVCAMKWKETARKIDPYHQKALRAESGMSDRQFEIVRKYTIHHLGRNFWQPMEAVKALDSECFPPFSVKFRDNHRNRACWYRPIDKAFKWLLNRDLASPRSTKLTRANLSQLEECHILLGGDHGQGAFRVVVTLLLFFKDCTLAFEGDMLCGFIECQKDTYAVLERTITDPLNCSLKRIGNELALCEAPDGSIYAAWGCNSPTVRAYRGVVLRTVPVQMFVVGDCAFLLLVQGREACSTYWCPFCEWGRDAWQTHKMKGCTCKKGKQWTLESMMECRHIWQIQKELGPAPSKAQIKGTKEDPLFDIPLENFLVGPLHVLDLFVNSAKALLDEYVWWRVENISVELEKARVAEALTRMALEVAVEAENQAKQDLDQAKAAGGPQSTATAQATLLFNEAECSTKAAKKIADKTAAKARSTEKLKENRLLNQPVRQQMDGMLAEEFHLLPSAYHGGDMVGNYCRKLIREADIVMPAVRNLLLGIPRAERKADDEEIESKIEVSHQVGRATDLRFRALGGNVDRKIACSLQFQANLADPQVKAAQEEVRAARARNFSKESKRKRTEKAEGRKKQRTHCLADIIHADQIEEDFPFKINLEMAGLRKAASADTTEQGSAWKWTLTAPVAVQAAAKSAIVERGGANFAIVLDWLNPPDKPAKTKKTTSSMTRQTQR